MTNATALDSASVDLRFATASGAIRTRIRGQKEGAANAGACIISTYVGGIETDALTIGSNRIPVINADQICINTAKTPASATATGTAGSVCWDSGFVYVCVAANSWKRAAIAAW